MPRQGLLIVEPFEQPLQSHDDIWPNQTQRICYPFDCSTDEVTGQTDARDVAPAQRHHTPPRREGVKPIEVEAGIATASPVRGLRPVRAGR